jgi:hypothetical protein
MANPYLNGRGTSHFQHMPNPYAYPTANATRTVPTAIQAMVTAPHPSQPDWQLHHCDETSHKAESQEVFREHFSHFKPRNLDQEHSLCLGMPKSDKPELRQRDADALLLTLGHDSYDFGSFGGISFKPTDQETQVLETSSLHEKNVMEAHEQFIHMLCTHKGTKAFAMYNGQFDFQFYRLFQGDKTRAKRNAVNNIFLLWSELFYHRLDSKPYQPLGFIVTLHSLFGEMLRRGSTTA